MAGLALRDEVERADAFYRFSVKCDRAMNAKIEAAARKAGMSATAFVQRHFDGILDPRPNPEKLASFDVAAFDPIAFGKRHWVSLLAAKLWAELRRHTGDDGTVQRFRNLLADDIGCDRATAGRLIERLIGAGLVEDVCKGKVGSPATYRVLGEG